MLSAFPAIQRVICRDTISWFIEFAKRQIADIQFIEEQFDETHTTVGTSIDEHREKLSKIVDDISKGYKVMIFMRGPPGCGKTFLARQIIADTTNDSWSDHIFSASDFFYDQRGRFNFNARHKRKSHQWNKKRIDLHVRNGWSPIIIDNTNIQTWKMVDHLKMAVQHGYLVEIAEPNTTWCKSVDELVARNVHFVPKETIERMISTYQPTTVSELMESNGLKYDKKMPQYRRLPILS